MNAQMPDAQLEAQWAAEDAALAEIIAEEKRVAWLVQLRTDAEAMMWSTDLEIVWRVNCVAQENASDTMVETHKFTLQSPGWYDVYLSTLRLALLEKENISAVEWFAARGVKA